MIQPSMKIISKGNRSEVIDAAGNCRYIGSDIGCMNFIDNNDLITEVNGKGVSRRELQDAFEKVQNKDNWKMSVNAYVPESDDAAKNLYAAAIEFFTGSKAEFMALSNGMVVKAEGYYAAVGA